ncbi:MAG: ABC transporter permease [Thermoplasmatota archaeon]
MSASESLRMSLRSLWSHKMRSVLTITGVVIGIASVLAVTSLGAAFEESITSQFDSVDDRSVFVVCGATGQQNGPPDCGQSSFVFTDVDRVSLESIPNVERVVASGEVTITSITYNGKQVPFDTLTATTDNADEVRKIEDYLIGGPFKDGQDQIVLGYLTAKSLSGAKIGEEPNIQPGAQVSIQLADGTTRNAQVAGVLAEQSALFGGSNTAIFAPIDPFYARPITSPTSGQTVPVFAGFTVVATDAAVVNQVRDDVKAFMNGQSDAATFLDGQDGLTILVATASDIQSDISSAFDQITVFIAGIAGVSLLVGGIMIGTIMLISVAERTKEIGMMKAIGAKDRQVLTMFLLEAAIIGLIGTIVGIGLGIGAGAALIGGLFGDDIRFIMPWNWVGIAVIVGVGTGIFAGLLPARRAVAIQPVEALNYE